MGNNKLRTLIERFEENFGYSIDTKLNISEQKTVLRFLKELENLRDFKNCSQKIKKLY